MRIFLKLPPNSRHLSITDKFVKTRRCPLFRGFPVLPLLSYSNHQIKQMVVLFLITLRHWEYYTTLHNFSSFKTNCNYLSLHGMVIDLQKIHLFLQLSYSASHRSLITCYEIQVLLVFQTKS